MLLSTQIVVLNACNIVWDEFPFILPVQPSSTTMIFYCQIIDFGLARVREISERTQRYQACAGTVSFTAPEVFEAKVEKGKEKKVDVYS